MTTTPAPALEAAQKAYIDHLFTGKALQAACEAYHRDMLAALLDDPAVMGKLAEVLATERAQRRVSKAMMVIDYAEPLKTDRADAAIVLAKLKQIATEK